jgi:hypothetical protein
LLGEESKGEEGARDVSWIASSGGRLPLSNVARVLVPPFHPGPMGQGQRGIDEQSFGVGLMPTST